MAVIVPLSHEPVSPFGVATTSPAGKVSVNATPVSDTAFAAGLVMVKVKLVVLFSGIVAAPNVLLMVGGATTVQLERMRCSCQRPTARRTSAIPEIMAHADSR